MANLDVVTLSLLILIGLVICLGFGLLALKRYEWAVLLVVFSSVALLFSPSNTTLTPDESETGVTSYVRAALLSLVGVIGIVKFLQLRMQGRAREGAIFILLALFVLLAVASAGYSIDPNVTWMRSLNFVALFCFLLGFYHWLEEERFDVVLGVLFWFVTGCAFANLISLAFPDLSWWWMAPHRFKGLWPEPNRMGSFCMIAYPICLWKYARSSGFQRWIVLGTLVSLAIMHVLSGSRSSMIGAVAGVLLWLLSSRGKLKSTLFLGGITLFFAAMMALNLGQFEREDNLGPADLTGRPELWDAGFFLVKERPILGYGYDIEGKIFDDPRFYERARSLWSGSANVSLHNGYLSVAVGLGVIGILLWLTVLLVPLWKTARLPRSEHKAVVLSIMVACLILNFSESIITGGRSLVAIIFWISWVMAERLSSAEAAVRHVHQVSLA